MRCLHDTPQLQLNMACLACDTARRGLCMLAACFLCVVQYKANVDSSWPTADSFRTMIDGFKRFPYLPCMWLSTHLHQDYLSMDVLHYKELCENSFFQRQLTFFRSWTSLSFEHHQPSMRNFLYTNNVMCWQCCRDWWCTLCLICRIVPLASMGNSKNLMAMFLP